MSEKEKTIIACLPVAGIENPFQHLMMQGLNSDPHIHAVNGINDKFFGIIRTAIIQKPDYIHFDWIESYYYRRWLWLTFLSIPLFYVQLFIVNQLMKIKLVWTLHNLAPHQNRHASVHQRAHCFLAKKINWIRVFSDSSVRRAAAYLNISESKFKVVPEGSYVDYYKNEICIKEAKAFFHMHDDAFVLLYFGLIKPYKGIIELVKSFKKHRHNNWRLIIAGKSMDENYMSLIRSQLDDSIILHEKFIDKNDVHYYFNAADVVVLPFRKIENSGSVILAMSFAKPVIAPHTGVLSQRLQTQSELLYDEDMASSFNKLKAINPTVLVQLGKNNREELKKYSWKDFAQCFN